MIDPILTINESFYEGKLLSHEKVANRLLYNDTSPLVFIDTAGTGFDEVMNILDEASQVRAYSHQLEEKSAALEAATAELRSANEQLKELDSLKDDFMSSVTHELRTPLTSIRAFSEMLQDDPQIGVRCAAGGENVAIVRLPLCKIDALAGFGFAIVDTDERGTELIFHQLAVFGSRPWSMAWPIT